MNRIALGTGAHINSLNLHLLTSSSSLLTQRSGLDISQSIRRIMDFGYNPWRYASEKSAAARRREAEAKNKFIYLKSQMDLALYENTMTVIGLGQLSKAKSPIKLLSSDTLEHVLAYAGIKPKGANVRAVAKSRGKDLAINVKTEDARLNLADMNVLQPGTKLTIPLTKPNLHLTGPCYRGKGFVCVLFQSIQNSLHVISFTHIFDISFPSRSTQVCKGSEKLGYQTY